MRFVKAWPFHLVVIGIFFFPYLGNTQFRVDQLVGMVALATFLLSIAHKPIPNVSRDMAVLFMWALLILLWAFVVTFASPGPMVTGLKLVNTFSYFAEGTALFFLLRGRLVEEHQEFLDVLLFYSILINLIGVITWFDNTGSFALTVVEYYGGVKNKAYGEFGNIGGESLAAGRISSLFPHSQAYAVFDLLIYAIAYSKLSSSPSMVSKSLAFFAMLLALGGGLMTASKTFFLAFGLMLVLQMGLGIRAFIKRPTISLPILISGSSFAAGVAYLFQYSRFIQDHVHLFTQGGIFTMFAPRFGAGGYLVTSGTIGAMLKPTNFLFGMGRVVDRYSWSDNGYIQVLTFGGIFFFVFFYSYIVYVMYLFWKYQTSQYQQMLLIFFVALSCSNMGTFIFLFPRTALLTTVVVAVVIGVGMRDLKRQVT